MSEVFDFSTTAASNNSAAPDGFPENMAYSDVNDAARELMAAIARDVEDGRGALATTGTAPDYALNSSRDVSGGYANGQVFGFRCHSGNSGAATTLNVDSLGATTVEMPDGSDPTFVTDGIYVVAYEGSNTRFVVISATNEGPQLYAESTQGTSKSLSSSDFSQLIRVTVNAITLTVPSSLGSGGEQIRIIKVLGSGTFTLTNSSGGTVYYPNGSDIADGNSTSLGDGTYTLIKLSGSDWVLTDS
jgi:hypothetical protein